MNHTLEILRIFCYAVGSLMLIHLAVVFPKLRIVLTAFSLYFLMWFILLFVQINAPDSYREIANLVSTPGLFVVVGMIFINLWATRKE